MTLSRTLFTVLVMAFMAVLMVTARGYDQKSSLFPLLVGGASLILGALAVVTELFPRIRDVFETNLFGVGDTRRDSESVHPMNFGIMTVWLVLLFLLIVFCGFLFALPAWIFCYVWFQGRRPWLYALITAVVIWFFLYGFFVQMMGMDLFKGVLLGERI